MKVLVRDWTHRDTGYGLPRTALKLLERRGDPLAQLLILEPSRANNIYPLIEQVRGRDASPCYLKAGWVSADAQIAREVLRDGRFRTTKYRGGLPFRFAQWIMAKTATDVANLLEPPSMLVTDPPRHTRLRRLMSRAFTPRALDALRIRIHEIAEGLLCGLHTSAECELIAQHTPQIPMAVTAETTTRFLSANDISWREFRAAMNALGEVDQYLAEHIGRIGHDDAANSMLCKVIRDGDVTDMAIGLPAGLLLSAGCFTTSRVLVKAVVTLAGHPDQLATLRANAEGWPNGIEEMLRDDTISQFAGHVASEDVDIQRYPATAERTRISAGRRSQPRSGDLRKPRCLRHNPQRRPRAHQLSTGVHACLGVALVRMEPHIGLQSLFEHFPQLTLAAEPIFNDTLGGHGFKHLPM